MESILQAIIKLFERLFMENDQNSPQPIITTQNVVPEAPQTHTEPTSLELWCSAAIIMEGANPANNNPGNIRFVPGTWMAKEAVGKNNGFCVFKDYTTGYNILKQFFINAATGKSEIYHPTDTLIDFYKKYAPSSDNNNPVQYAQFVASKIGMGVNTQIKEIV